jgi:N-hydroxyarylamine O-acetyltransferase
VLDLDAYLARIGLHGRPSVAEVHHAHVTSIPFENLDPYCGIPVSLAVEDLERKLVSKRRGGYCFEHNLLLKAALEALGAEVGLFLARVRLGAARGVTRPRSHLVLRVRADGSDWLADVGFGLGSLLEPLPFGPGGEYLQSGWRFRVIRSRALLRPHGGMDGSMSTVTFLTLSVRRYRASNWFTSTHPGRRS